MYPQTRVFHRGAAARRQRAREVRQARWLVLAVVAVLVSAYAPAFFDWCLS